MTKAVALPVQANIPASPEILAAKVQPSPIVEQAKSLVISNTDDVTTAKDIRSQLKAREKFILDDPTGPKFGENIKMAHALHKSLVAAKDVFIDPIHEAVDIIDRKLGAYELEQRRQKEAAERLAREEQEKERERVLAAAQQKIDKAMKVSDKTEKQIDKMQLIIDDPESTEEAKMLAARQVEVLQLQLGNHQEKAADIQKAAERVVDALPVAAPSAVNYQKTAGVKVKKYGEITDKMALIRSVVEGKAPESILEINMGMLNKMINMGINFPEGVIIKKEAKYGGRG